MADAKHTPGPLSVMRSNGPKSEGEVGILNDHRDVVAECWADIRHEGEQALDEAMANAILFAAAPELLKALSAIVDRNFSYMDRKVNGYDGPITQKQIADARAAIARATGSAS